MDSESAILKEFLEGGLAFLDAVERLQSLGYDPKEAEQMVDEWADGAEADHDQDLSADKA